MKFWKEIGILLCIAMCVLMVSCGTQAAGDISSTENGSVYKDGTEDDYSGEDSIYDNPIDKYFLPRIFSWSRSQAEIRTAQDGYKKVWKDEFDNLIKWLQKKCAYEEDKKNVRDMKKSVEKNVEASMKVVQLELIDAYDVNPDPSKVEDHVSRISYWGNGTRSRLNQIEGQMYRDACMKIVNLNGGVEGEETYEFRKVDYEKEMAESN